MRSQKCYNQGKMFAKGIDVELCKRKDLYYVSISLGEEYYETDPYQNKDYALSEAKGYLDGLKTQICNELLNIERQLND
jgi:hypothetical protein